MCEERSYLEGMGVSTWLFVERPKLVVHFGSKWWGQKVKAMARYKRDLALCHYYLHFTVEEIE